MCVVLKLRGDSEPIPLQWQYIVNADNTLQINTALLLILCIRISLSTGLGFTFEMMCVTCRPL